MFDNTTSTNWQVALTTWDEFVASHPELGLGAGHWAWHNFLRRHKAAMVAADAIRMANGRHWIAQPERFERAAFEALTTLPDYLAEKLGYA